MAIRCATPEQGGRRPSRRVVLVRVGVAITLLAATAPAAPALPDTDTLLADLGLSTDEIAQVKAGQLVRHSIDSASERELTAAMAFLVKATPAQLVADSKRDLLDQTMADTVSYGTVSAPARSPISPGSP